MQGQIAKAPRGSRDYYYDSIFIPSGHTKTYAEMTIAEKTAISHVRIAYEKFAEYLLVEQNNIVIW